MARAKRPTPFLGSPPGRRQIIWATTQNDLGLALAGLGERESGTGKFEEAVSAYREALKEWTEEAAPSQHRIAQENLDRANALLAQRRNK